jgi:hypothetical protein
LSGGTNTESWTDQCTGINNVIEYYCMPKNANPLVGGGSGPGQGTYACPHGCSNGECNP